MTHLILPNPSAEDRRASELLLAGSIWLALQGLPGLTRAELTMADGSPTNELVIEIASFPTPYRVTVTAAPELSRDGSAHG